VINSALDQMQKFLTEFGMKPSSRTRINVARKNEDKDDTCLPIIYAADQDEDWTSPKVWERANPRLGESVKLQYLLDESNRAKESPGYQNTFRRLHLNQWTEQAERFLDMDAWDGCAEPVDPLELKGSFCWAGLDLHWEESVNLVLGWYAGRLEIPPAETAIERASIDPGRRETNPSARARKAK
jgi:hypothetical protein